AVLQADRGRGASRRRGGEVIYRSKGLFYRKVGTSAGQPRAKNSPPYLAPVRNQARQKRTRKKSLAGEVRKPPLAKNQGRAGGTGGHRARAASRDASCALPAAAWEAEF